MFGKKEALKLKKPNVFICYRRDDGSGYTGRLYDGLKKEIGSTHLFRDINTIRPGEDFDKVITKTIGSCDFLLAIIGKQWLDARKLGSRRLDDPADLVRREIATAFLQNVQVIPILVDGAKMPERDELPDELTPLAGIHAMEISDHRWDDDLVRLVDILLPISKRPLENEGRRPGRSIWDLARKLFSFCIICVSLILFFFRWDIVDRLIISRESAATEELFFPFFLLLIGLFIYNYKFK